MQKKTVIFDIGNVLIRFRWIDFIHELFDSEETIRGVEDAMWMSGLWNELDRGVVSEEMILQDIISRRPEYEAEIKAKIAAGADLFLLMQECLQRFAFRHVQEGILAIERQEFV